MHLQSCLSHLQLLQKIYFSLEKEWIQTYGNGSILNAKKQRMLSYFYVDKDLVFLDDGQNHQVV